MESDDTLSRVSRVFHVFHELKPALSEDAPLFVAPLAATPKLRGLAPGIRPAASRSSRDRPRP